MFEYLKTLKYLINSQNGKINRSVKVTFCELKRYFIGGSENLEKYIGWGPVGNNFLGRLINKKQLHSQIQNITKLLSSVPHTSKYSFLEEKRGGVGVGVGL